MKSVMESRQIEDVEVHRGSGNVFADLGLVDAEKLKIKPGLVIEIRKGPCAALILFSKKPQNGWALPSPKSPT